MDPNLSEAEAGTCSNGLRGAESAALPHESRSRLILSCFSAQFFPALRRVSFGSIFLS